MKSAIYTGVVRHRRTSPVDNSFRCSLFMIYLDLAELDEVFRGRRLWSASNWNVAWLRRKDHLGDPRIPLDLAVRDLVEEQLGTRPVGPIRMLTHLRYFGHNFNPVSFYYCFDPSDSKVETIVVEIHNTPWGELYCYVLGEGQNDGTVREKRYQFTKAFHVSPFMDMGLWCDWRFTEPGKTLRVQMTNFEKGQNIFAAELSLTRQEITGSNLTRVLLAYPPMTMKVVAAIYWQALRLWIKGAPFYDHPTKQEHP
jgi:DUF1365 family protein